MKPLKTEGDPAESPALVSEDAAKPQAEPSNPPLQENQQQASEEAAIRQAIDSYVKAFNSQDVESLGAHWSLDGVYINRTTGERVVGRDAIKQEFQAMASQTTQNGGEPASQLAVATESIQLLSPNVAIERGVATVTAGDEIQSESHYSVVYFKRDGKWLIDRVTEDEIVEEPSNYERLRGLEWLVGEWTDKGEDFTIRTACNWTRNQNYLSRTYTVTEGEDVTSSGLQVIGWDPKLKQIRSWLFDSSGGFVQGTWTQKGERWFVQSVGTLADGTTGSFTSIFRPIDEGSYGWQKVDRTMAGEMLPNVDEVVVTRD